MSDIEEMRIESLRDAILGLTYILLKASLTSDAIDQVVTFTADVISASISSSSDCAPEFATSV